MPIGKINLAKLFVLHKVSFETSSSSNLINTFNDLFLHTYLDGCQAVVRINCSLVTPVKDKCKVTVISDVYFDVARILSIWMKHRIIKLSHKTFIS